MNIFFIPSMSEGFYDLIQISIEIGNRVPLKQLMCLFLYVSYCKDPRLIYHILQVCKSTPCGSDSQIWTS